MAPPPPAKPNGAASPCLDTSAIKNSVAVIAHGSTRERAEAVRGFRCCPLSGLWDLAPPIPFLGEFPKSWGGKLSAPRTHTAVGRARPNGDRLRRGEGKFGWRREIERLVGLRRQFAIFSDPARQQSLGSFVNPLLEQCGDFFAQIGGVVQARKLEAFQGRG